jgi:hypothetical protein
MIRFVVAAVLVVGASSICEAVLVFPKETFGTTAANGQALAGYTGYASGLAISGTGDLRTSTVSTGYTGASGGINVMLNTTGETLVLPGIDTSAYTGTFDLSFGARKSTGASDLTGLVVEYSTNGSSWASAASIPAQPTGSGTSVYRLISFTGISLPVSPTLSLRWRSTDTVEYRVDDITLDGVLAPVAVPEPSAFLFGGLMAVVAAFGRRARGDEALAA